MARVLVIEDNADQREVFSSLLYYNGFEVDQAASAEDAFLNYVIEIRELTEAL